MLQRFQRPPNTMRSTRREPMTIPASRKTLAEAFFWGTMAAPRAPDDPGETVGAVLLVLKYALGDLFQSFPRMPLSSRATACNTRKMKI